MGPRTIAYTLFFSLSCFFFVFFWGVGDKEVGFCFGVFVCVGFFFFFSFTQLSIADTNSFISNVFIFFYCSPDFLQLKEFIYRWLIEDILTVLNKLSEKPGQYNKLVWLSPLQSLACLGLLCFHFPRGWISDVLWNPQSRIQMFKWQKPVHSNPNAQGYFFWQDPGTQTVILSAGCLLSINHFWQKKRPSKNLWPLAYTQAAKGCSSTQGLCRRDPQPESTILRFLPWDSPEVCPGRPNNLVSHTPS